MNGLEKNIQNLLDSGNYYIVNAGLTTEPCIGSEEDDGDAIILLTV